MSINVALIQYTDHVRLSIAGTYDLQEAIGQFSDLLRIK